MRSHIKFNSGGGTVLEFLDSPDPEVLCSLQPGIDETETVKYESPYLSEVPECLWAPSSTDIRKIKSAEPIKIQIDHSKPLPKLPQYPLQPELL